MPRGAGQTCRREFVVARFPQLLDAASAVLLDPCSSRDAQQRACEALHSAALALIPAPGESFSSLPSGRALSPADAARCVLDPLRTSRLLRAVDEAITQTARHRVGAAVQVLYAGCGPLAPLLLTVARRHGAERLQIVLMDVHADAVAAACRLFDAAGVSRTIRAALCADAAQFRLDSALRADVLVVETMQRALQHEPQVAVLANLVPQCAASVRLVPECIRVSVCLTDVERTLGARTPLGAVLELSRATLPELIAAVTAGADALPALSLRVPDVIPGMRYLMLETEIETGTGERLGGDDSGLTAPHPLFGSGAVEPGCLLSFRYRLGSDPGFEVRRERQ